VGLALLSHGERARAERLWQIAMDEAERTRDARAAAWAMLGPVIRSTVDGRFDDAVEAGRLLQARATDLGTPVLGERYAAASTRAARIYSGRAAEVMEGMTPNTLAGEAGWHEGMNPRRSVEAGLCYLQLGQRDEAAAVLAGVLGELAPDEMSIIVLCWLLEIATWLDDRAAIAELLPRLAPASGLISVRVGTIGPVVARELGAAAAVLGEHVKARDCYRQAIGVCEKVRFRPEMALTRLQLAEVLLEHYPAERAEAAEHLAFAISEFRDMKMQPSLERALRHKEVLKA